MKKIFNIIIIVGTVGIGVLNFTQINSSNEKFTFETVKSFFDSNIAVSTECGVNPGDCIWNTGCKIIDTTVTTQWNRTIDMSECIADCTQGGTVCCLIISQASGGECYL